MLGVFALGLWLRGVHQWPPVILILGLIMLLPAYRNLLAALGALYYVLFQETWVNWGMIQRVATVEGISGSWWTTMPMHYFWLAAVLLFFAGFWFLARRPGSCRWPKSTTPDRTRAATRRSEEHTSELQS